MTVRGAARKRVLRYHATIPAGITVRLAEETGRLLHVISAAHSGSGAIGADGRRGPAVSARARSPHDRGVVLIVGMCDLVDVIGPLANTR